MQPYLLHNTDTLLTPALLFNQFHNIDKMEDGTREVTRQHLKRSISYGVPFPPKFNVQFYIVLCTIYPTFCVCHLSLQSQFNFFAFNIQLWFMQHSSFRFRHSTFHKQQSGFGILPSSSVECTFIFSHLTFRIFPLSFHFRHPTLSIVLASFRIRHSTLRLWLLPAGQWPMEIVGSIDLTHPRSNGGWETSQWSGLGRPSPLPTNQTSTTTWPIARMLLHHLLVKTKWEPLCWGWPTICLLWKKHHLQVSIGASCWHWPLPMVSWFCCEYVFLTVVNNYSGFLGTNISITLNNCTVCLLKSEVCQSCCKTWSNKH